MVDRPCIYITRNERNASYNDILFHLPRIAKLYLTKDHTQCCCGGGGLGGHNVSGMYPQRVSSFESAYSLT